MIVLMCIIVNYKMMHVLFNYKPLIKWINNERKLS